MHTQTDYEFHSCLMSFKDTPDRSTYVTIAIGVDLEDNSFDDEVFYYCDDEAQFKRLFDPLNTESDFYLIEEETND